MLLWLTFALALVAFAVSVSIVVVSLLVAAKARPFVQSYGPMVRAMMPAAAGTGGSENVATSSPAAVSAAIDWCEYGDHDWSAPTSYGDGVSTHYCLRCGYTEQVPGT